MAGRFFATITDNEGNSREFTAEEMAQAVDARPGLLSELVDGSYTVSESNKNGFAVIDFHPERIFERFPDGLDDGMPLMGFPEVFLKPGKYGVLYNFFYDGESFLKGEPERTAADTPNGILLVSDEDLVTGENQSLMTVTLYPQDEDGNDYPDPQPYEPIELFTITGTGNSSTNRIATVHDFIESIVMLASLAIAQDGGANVPGPQIIKTGKLWADAMRGKPNRAGEVWQTGTDFLAEMGAIKITAASKKALDTALASSKTLIQLNALATASDYKYAPNRTLTVHTTLDEMLGERIEGYASLSKSAKSKRRAKVKEEILSLAGAAWHYTDENGDFVRVPIAGGVCSVVHGNVYFVFSAEFMGAALSRDSGRMALDPALLRTDEKNNPYAVTIGFKLLSHSYQNIGKPNECTLSVERLLDFVNGIPTYEEVKEKDRAYTRRIVEPLERDLNHLQEIGVLEWWEYCHAKGEPLTDEEQAARFTADGEEGPLPYDIAITVNIQWQLSNTYDEQRADTVKSRAKRAELAEAAKQRNAERNKRIERKKEGYIARKAAEKELG